MLGPIPYQCKVCQVVGTPADIGTELCNSGECVICHCKDTHLTGDGGESCELSRGMVQYHRLCIRQLGYSTESCTIVLSIILLDVVFVSV